MFLKAFAFLDIKTGLYSQPMFFAHKGHAVRAALGMGHDHDNTIGRYPYDFRLVHVGEYDDAVGILHNVTHDDLGTVGSIMAAHDMQRKAPSDSEPDLSEMTAAEVVQFREASKSA